MNFDFSQEFENGHIIRPLHPGDIHQYIEIYLNAYPSGKDLSADGIRYYTEKTLKAMSDFDDINFFGYFQDNKLVATMKLIDFSMNLYGKMVPATGLMALGVHPIYKKQGIAGRMVEFFEDYTKKSGALVSLLLPFRVDFYRRLGYGCGTRMTRFHIPTDQLPKSATDSALTLELLDKSQIGDVLSCYEDFAEHNHGALKKFSEEIRDINEDCDTKYIGCYDDEFLEGYAAFKIINDSSANYTINHIEVKELIYSNSTVLRKLLNGLRMQSDLASSVILTTGEEDFYHILTSPQDVTGNYYDFGFLQTNTQALGTMYKIPDLPRFIAASYYREFPHYTISIGITVTSEDGGDIEKLGVLFQPDEGNSKVSRMSCEPFSAGSDVFMRIKLSDLSAVLMGSARINALVRLGAVTLSDDSFVEALDRLFLAEQMPYTNTDY